MEKSIQQSQATPLGPPGGPPGPPGGWLCQRMSLQREILFNVMVAFLQLIPQSTLTTVFPVSKDIAESFSIANPSVLPWLVAAYALSFGTFILVGGRLGDIFGYKTTVVVGYSLLACWSVVAGLSHYAGYPLFFVARGFQGLGASLMVPNGLALLGRTYPPGSKKKILSFTVFGLCAPVGAYLGMIFGALFTKFASWWWSFYTLAMVSAVLAILAQLVLISPPPSPKQLQPFKAKLEEMDWLGAITGVGGLICVQVSLVSAPAAGWSTQYIFMLLIMGGLLIVFFVITELKIAKQPLVPFRMLKADVGFVLGAVACGWATFGIWTWFLWKYLLNIKQDSPLDAAVHVIPIVPVAFIASVLTAWMMRKCQPAWTLLWALVAFTFGPLLLAVDSGVDKTSYWTWTFLSLVVMPFGMDMSFPAATFIMSNFFPPQQQGVAGSLISTVVNYSISLGLGLASTVEVHVNNHGRDPLAGIRGGWFMGVGLGGLGVLICVAFVVKSIFHPTPPPPKGPPGPAAGAGGPPMQMTPQSPQGRQIRSDTVSSRATTVVATPVTPKPSDLELFQKFQFDTAQATTRSPVTAASPRTNSVSNHVQQHSPSWPSAHPSRTPPQKQPKSARKDSSGHHHRSESTQHLQSSHSTQSSMSHHGALPRLPMPTEIEPAYRGRGSWESEDQEQDRTLEPWSPTNREKPVHAPGLGSGRKDSDGSGADSRPVAPRNR